MRQASRRLVVALLATSAIAPLLPGVARAQGSAIPVNEATRDPALTKIIAAMIAAAKARDFKRLAPHVGERIQLDFGGGKGRTEFGRRLARVPAAWDQLVWVLEHGGRFEKDGSFWAPYTFSVDLGKLDAFEAGVVVERTKAHAEPRADAAVLAELDRVVVKVTAVFALGGGILVDVMTGLDAVRAAARTYLPWPALYPIVAVWCFQLDGIYIGATRTAEMRNGMALALAGFLALGYALMPFFGNHGLRAAFAGFAALRGAFLALLYPRLLGPFARA